MRKVLFIILLVANIVGQSSILGAENTAKLEIKMVWEKKFGSGFSRLQPPSLDPETLNMRFFAGGVLYWIDSEGNVLYSGDETEIVRRGREELVRTKEYRGRIVLDGVDDYTISKNFLAFALWTPMKRKHKTTSLEVFRWDAAKKDYVLLWSKPREDTPVNSYYGMKVSDNGYVITIGGLSKQARKFDKCEEGVAVIDPSGKTISVLEEGDEFFGPVDIGSGFDRSDLHRDLPNVIEFTGITPDADTIAIAGRSKKNHDDVQVFFVDPSGGIAGSLLLADVMFQQFQSVFPIVHASLDLNHFFWRIDPPGAKKQRYGYAARSASDISDLKGRWPGPFSPDGRFMKRKTTKPESSELTSIGVVDLRTGESITAPFTLDDATLVDWLYQPDEGRFVVVTEPGTYEDDGFDRPKKPYVLALIGKDGKTIASGELSNIVYGPQYVSEGNVFIGYKGNTILFRGSTRDAGTWLRMYCFSAVTKEDVQ